MPKWTQEAAEQELDALTADLGELENCFPGHPYHMRWLLRVNQFMLDVFGPSSMIAATFLGIRWQYVGSMAVHVEEVFRPGSTQKRYDLPVYRDGLLKAAGVLMAAREELTRNGVEGVYRGKNSGPEASLIMRVMNLAEVKLRKVLRAKPQEERTVQDAFEDLLVGADVPYSREADSIEYSSKTYIPDFTVPKADLAIEIKLATQPRHEKEFIAQINDDILAYRTKYGNLFFVVYDCGFIRDVDRFVGSFETHGAVTVRVVKH